MSIYDYQPILIYCVFLAICIGSVMGSFLNCTAWRIVHGESFVHGRSHCTTCGHVLGATELIPIFSWLFQKGKCKNCGHKISVRYPLTELACALMTVLCLLRFDLSILCLRNYVFLCCLFLLTLTDLEDMIIPDGCLITAVVAWIAALPFTYRSWQDILFSVLAGILYGGGLLGISLVMDKLLGRDSLGGGDIKLFAVIGLYLGMVGTLFTIVFSCIIGLAIHGLSVLLRKHDTDTLTEKNIKTSDKEPKSEEEHIGAFPFGPSIAVAAAYMLLYGDKLIGWYQGLLL